MYIVLELQTNGGVMSALNNGGGNVTWATGYYCFWAVVMGN